MLGRHTTVHALEDFIPIYYYVNTGELGARHRYMGGTILSKHPVSLYTVDTRLRVCGSPFCCRRTWSTWVRRLLM
eukprot:5255010-Prymnesium_polylepis.1